MGCHSRRMLTSFRPHSLNNKQDKKKTTYPDSHTHTHVHSVIKMHTHTHTHTHTHRHRHTHTYTHTRMRARTHARMHAHTHTHTHTHAHTRTHTHTHTHAHTHTHTRAHTKWWEVKEHGLRKACGETDLLIFKVRSCRLLMKCEDTTLLLSGAPSTTLRCFGRKW